MHFMKQKHCVWLNWIKIILNDFNSTDNFTSGFSDNLVIILDFDKSAENTLFNG